MNRKKTGATGEKLACDYLKRKGIKILATNYCCRIGEIDIVAKDCRTLVFCEVKARNNKEYGEPFEAVNAAKQQRLKRLAEVYLQSMYDSQRILKEFDCRFDVVSIVFDSEGSAEIVHIKNAF